MSTILRRIGWVLPLVMGFGLVAWGFATIFFPQPEHVAAFNGSALGLVRDLPGWAVGIWTCVLGIALVYAALIFRRNDPGASARGYWGLASWDERHSRHLRVR